MKDKKKVLLVNPHINAGFFGKTVYNFITNRKDYKKYQHLLDVLINDHEIDLYFYFDGRDSSFSFKFPLRIELLCWYLINFLNPFKLKPIFQLDRFSFDLVFLFSHRNLDKSEGKNLVREIKKVSDTFVVHLTHFHADIQYTARNIKELAPAMMCAESNLPACSGLYKKYFSFFEKKFFVLPFCPQDRFKKNKDDFNLRIKKAMAVGTLHEYSDSKRTEEFTNFYGTHCLHPMRKEIFINSDSIKKEIDSFIYEWLDVEKIDTKKANKGFFGKIYAKYSNHFLSKAKSYFEFDMVETFNSYKMFIAPSEITGLPAIGMSEGMMCGCVFIGINDLTNKDLGLIDKKNFIGYDGTLPDLIKVINFYQQNPKLLENISNEGLAFAKNNFDKEKVASDFIENIKSLC